MLTPFFPARRHWASFFSTTTGHAWVKSFFLNHDEDRVKMFVHSQNRAQWRSIREDVKAYTLENWARWEDEEPDWFNDSFKNQVDSDMIPPGILGGHGGHTRRRSSLGAILEVMGTVEYGNGNAESGAPRTSRVLPVQ